MPRSMWTGAISFGLVSVPVKLYPAISQKDIGFHQVDEKSGARIRYKRVSEKTGREVPFEQIKKGYELDDDRYVIIDPKELEELDPKRTHAIDIEDFVDISEIDPIYFEHAYYLAPDKGGDKAYTLLRKAMEDSGKIAIGRVVLRTKEYLAAIRPYGRGLALETMLYPDEVVDIEDLPLPERSARISETELRMAKQLIGSLATEFDPSKYRDTYRERVLDLIQKKAKGHEVVRIEEPEVGTKVVDLLDALKASVEKTGSRKGPGSGGSRKRSSRRKSA